MKPITMFSFGYYGWGNSTKHLVRIVDAVEESRGFRPPIFVDCRIRRAVRAVGFNGAAFENLLGPSRHRWMRELGNKRIISRVGPGIQIAEPKAASDLLDIAIQAAAQKRRILFFCSCQFPKIDGRVSCHRTAITSLLQKFAKKRKVPLEIVEWPGGAPKSVDFDVEPQALRAIEKGLMAFPLPKGFPLHQSGDIAWCSTARFHADGRTIHRLVGPAIWRHEKWCLPVMYLYYDPDVTQAAYKRQATRSRRSWGYDSRISQK